MTGCRPRREAHGWITVVPASRPGRETAQDGVDRLFATLDERQNLI